MHVLSAILFCISPLCAYAVNGTDVTLKTVVIDAGHGGHDPGTVSPDRKTYESHINLDVALALGRRIKAEYPDVKVIYTRSKDVFVPLAERADIANRNHADLFISIHVNSMPRGAKASGSETFVMGTDKSASNMEVCRRENSVIRLEDDYSTTYQGFDPDNAESYIFFNLMQNAHFEQSIAFASMVEKKMAAGPIHKSRGIRQAPLMVLWRTTMPSVLIEIGFLSDAGDRSILVNKSNREKIAQSIFDAFCTFKMQYDAHTGFSYEDVPMDDPARDEEAAAPSGMTGMPGSGRTAEREESMLQQQEDVPANIGDKSSVPGRESVRINEQKPVDNSKGCYRIQIFATGKKLGKGSPEFKGINSYDCTFANGMYKYTVGKYSGKAAAQKELSALRKKFPGAFIVFY